MSISKKSPQNTYQFVFLTWTMVTFFSFLLSLIWIEIGEPPDLKIIQGMIGGTIIGSFQALILSRFFPHAWLWILATLIPWGLMGGSQFGVMGWFVPRTELIMIRLQTGLILGGITGVWLGLWQWWVLKPILSNSYLWIIFNGISWSLGLALGWVIGGILLLKTNLFLGEVIGLAIAWLLIGLQTGIGLGYLLRMEN
ncbi:MAG: hypothetical protein QNJ64_02315 [Crocosphaera sp.]|nr:hypothetical protein [Crocosphaera sp.]